jgi:hypothetical protein
VLSITPDDLDKYLSALQHFVTVAAILLGGLWALYTFWGQRTLQRANLDVAKSQGEIKSSDAQLKKLEQETIQQPILSMAILEGVTTEDGYPVSMIAVVRNDGKLAMDFDHTTLSLKRVLDHKREDVAHPELIQIDATWLVSDGYSERMDHRVLRAGVERRLAFVMPKLAAGTYFIELRSEYGGMQIVKGRFERSSDARIDAIEQSVLRVPKSGVSGPHGADK